MQSRRFFKNAYISLHCFEKLLEATRAGGKAIVTCIIISRAGKADQNEDKTETIG